MVVYTGLNGAINIQFIQYNSIIFHKHKQNTTFSLFHKIFYGPLKLQNFKEPFIGIKISHKRKIAGIHLI